jgi:dCTP deaminase
MRRESGMPLTGAAIAAEVARRRILIAPFAAERAAANSYGVRLAPAFMRYADAELDAQRTPQAVPFAIPPEGGELQPGTIYLAHTVETIGSPYYIMTLDALPAVSARGIWVQFSAPLGHIGAHIPWTLEIAVVHPVVVYPGMPIAKVAFWPPVGAIAHYRGRYVGSTGVVASRLTEGDRS